MPEAMAGDPATWVDAHGDALYRYAVARVRDAASAEDLVQETFLAALGARSAFRGDAAERTWLIGILRHKLCDLLRRQRREVEADIGEDDAVAGMFDRLGAWRVPPKAWSLEGGETLESAEFHEVLARCREALPERQAQVVALRLMDELESAEVCKLLAISETNLGVLLHRARARLRACLELRWFSGEGRR